MRIAILLGVATLAVATPACADWGPTKWGATRDATLAILGSTARKVEGRENERVFGQDIRAKAPGMFDGVAVTQEFYFDPDKGGLTVVRLLPANAADCPTFIAAARKRYGKADSEVSKSFPVGRGVTLSAANWRDQPVRLSVLLSVMTFTGDPAPNYCHLAYRPLDDSKTL